MYIDSRSSRHVQWMASAGKQTDGFKTP